MRVSCLIQRKTDAHISISGCIVARIVDPQIDFRSARCSLSYGSSALLAVTRKSTPRQFSPYRRDSSEQLCLMIAAGPFYVWSGHG